MKLLEETKEGWSFVGINRKTNIFRCLPKFHYFKNGISLCGKYQSVDDNYISGLFQEDCCKKCYKLKQARLNSL